MKHLKSFHESLNTNGVIFSPGSGKNVIHINGNNQNLLIQPNTLVDMPNSNINLINPKIVYLYFVAQFLEGRYDFKFLSKELIDDNRLMCSFVETDKYKISISSTNSETNVDIILCIKQTSGNYMLSHEIPLSGFGDLLKEIELWRQSKKLSKRNKKLGVFETWTPASNEVYTHSFRVGDEYMYFKDDIDIPGWNISMQALHGTSMKVNFYIASQIEKKYDFSFTDKEIKGQYLYCSFPDSDQYKISISQYMTSDNYQIVLCIKQEDGRYLRNQTINISTIEKILYEIQPWRKSNKLGDINKKIGTFD